MENKWRATLIAGGLASLVPLAEGLKLLARSNVVEVEFLTSNLRDGNGAVWQAASQLNYTSSQSAKEIGQGIFNHFADNCSYLVGKVLVDVHNSFCDTVRNVLSNVPNDPYILGWELSILGIAGATCGILFGALLTDV